jgi:hypothetical protein
MSNKRYLWWATIAVYTPAIVLLHKRGNEAAAKLIEAMGMTPYLLTMRLAAVAGIVAVFVALGKRLWSRPERFKEILIFLGIVTVLDLSLISVPIERIHYFQYGMLTWLAWKAIGRDLPAALLAFVAGALDEAHQYWVLYANDHVVYYDWNDNVLNLIGVLIVFFLFLPRDPVRRLPLRAMAITAVVWIGAVTLLVSALNPDRYLFRDDPYKGVPSFWITSGINTNYHVMNTWQGMSFVGILLILTFAIRAQSTIDALQDPPRRTGDGRTAYSEVPR